MLSVGQIVFIAGTSLLLLLIDGYIVVVHLLIKQLLNLFGMLLMFYSFAVVGFSISIVLLAMGLHTLCHYFTVLVLYNTVSIEVFATCILHHVAYIMYHTYKLKPKTL